METKQWSMKGENEMTKFFRKKRELLVDEKDVTTVIAVINRHRRLGRFKIFNCGMADNPSRWSIRFRVNDKVYAKIVKNLADIGRFDLDVRPKIGTVNMIFMREDRP